MLPENLLTHQCMPESMPVTCSCQESILYRELLSRQDLLLGIEAQPPFDIHVSERWLGSAG